MDVKAACPEAQVLCTDLLATLPLLNTDVTSYILDANETDWGWRDRFDYIHFRDMDGGIRDWEATFKTAFNCQRAEGFLSLEQLVFYQPPENPCPGSIWYALQQALDYIKAQKGLAFALHDTQGVQKKLESSGYEIVSKETRSFPIKFGMYKHDACDLLCAIIELMKGVLVRGWELQPEVANKESLLRRLEMEVGRGLTVKAYELLPDPLRLKLRMTDEWAASESLRKKLMASACRPHNTEGKRFEAWVNGDNMMSWSIGISEIGAGAGHLEIPRCGTRIGSWTLPVSCATVCIRLYYITTLFGNLVRTCFPGCNGDPNRTTYRRSLLSAPDRTKLLLSTRSSTALRRNKFLDFNLRCV